MSVAPFKPATTTRPQYDTNFQISPIALLFGLAGADLSPITDFMPFFSPETRFVVMEGATTVNQSIGMYPFANQSVAANATIQQPLTVSMRLISPVTEPGGYGSKNQSFTAFFNSLQAHNNAGGVYYVYTPSYTYLNCVLLNCEDITSGNENTQRQIEWQLDFIQPILTIQGAIAAENRLISLLSAGQMVPPNAQNGLSWSGQAGSSGGVPGNPASLAGLQASSIISVSATQ